MDFYWLTNKVQRWEWFDALAPLLFSYGCWLCPQAGFLPNSKMVLSVPGLTSACSDRELLFLTIENYSWASVCTDVSHVLPPKRTTVTKDLPLRQEGWDYAWANQDTPVELVGRGGGLCQFHSNHTTHGEGSHGSWSSNQEHQPCMWKEPCS